CVLTCRSTPPSTTHFFLYRLSSETYTLSLHDALPIYDAGEQSWRDSPAVEPLRRTPQQCSGAQQIQLRIQPPQADQREAGKSGEDRKSTRLNSSHRTISYAVFCLKKKIWLIDTDG